MNNKNILVLGSGNQSKINNIYFDKVYASNASIIKVKDYYSNLNKLNIFSVSTFNSLLSDIPTINNLNIIKPNKIIIRRGLKNNFEKLRFKYIPIFFDKFKQYNFQRKFFYFGIFTLFFSQFFYGNSINDKIKYFKNCIIYKKGFLGISTGFFAILVALEENPNDKIYVTGITMENSIHFYKLMGKENKIMTRHKVDNFMIRFLKKKFKKRLYTNDKIFSKLANINAIN